MDYVLLPKKPVYVLSVNNSTDLQTIDYLKFTFTSLSQISKFLKMADIEHYNVSCELTKQYIKYDDDLTLHQTQGEGPETALLENIKAIWYDFVIYRSSVSEEDGFSFNSINEIKRFIAKYYGPRSNSFNLYKIYKVTRYFDKNDNYRINTFSEEITPSELNNL